MKNIQNIAVLMTCFNRRAKTLACLEALFKQENIEDVQLHVFLVDDGCTDGTGDAVRGNYPDITVLQGDGSLFWNGGMRLAFGEAMKQGFDYYLWLNDDTVLYPIALKTLISTSLDLQVKQRKDAIVVGSTQDVNNWQLTYGGVTRPVKWRSTTFALISPCDTPVECETMNGNCVLIPYNIVRSVGNLESEFAHAMGDLDYGLRTRYAGFSIWVMPGFAGTCSNNSADDSYKIVGISASKRLIRMIQPKGLPFSSWHVFTKRHTGWLWPMFWLWPYLKVLLKN